MYNQIRKNTIGKFLKNARNLQGLTQKQLADTMGYSSAQYISNIERGKCDVSINVLIKLASTLDALDSLPRYYRVYKSQKINVDMDVIESTIKSTLGVTPSL